MTRHRTTARGVLLLLICVLGLLAAVAAAWSKPPGKHGKPPKKHHGVARRIVFPVIGRTQYINDFGDPRPGGRHQGNDIMAPRKALAVAAESGKVEFWNHSSTAGCMLYLYGKSGTTYLYIHLNNDKTNHNDNRGHCSPGMSYAPKLRSGQSVKAGQMIGYVGDSGDANGIHPHLHFELHPHGGRAVSPYRYLNRGRHLIFTALPASKLRTALWGTVLSTTSTSLTMRLTSLEAWPGKFHVRSLHRTLTVHVPADAAVLERILGGNGATSTITLDAAVKGQRVAVKTTRQAARLALFLGRPNALVAAQVVLAAPEQPPAR